MTDTNTLAPTDAEIIALADETRTGEPGRDGYILPISFARAVLAKWGAPATTSSEPVAVPAGIEPAGIVTVTSHKTFLDLSISEWRDECPDGEYPVFTAAQVQAMLDAAPRNAPLYDPDDVAFSAWCCAMDDGITAAKKGGQHAER